jgi:E3 ubiquitin-protein ligase TRIP12
MSHQIPEGNKLVAKRQRENLRRIHKEKLAAARACTDTKEPAVYGLQHLRVNMKREQMLEERYSEIDRHNQILLQKMTEIIRHPAQSKADRGPGPTTLNKDRRRRELVRITNENQGILKRIQEAQPVYNHLKWEEAYHQSERYMNNVCEYPIVLGSARRRPHRLPPKDDLQLEVKEKPVDPQKDGGPKSARDGPAAKAVFGVHFVHKETLAIGDQYYLVEIGTDGRAMTVTAYSGETQQTLELLVSERVHRRLYRECGGSYAHIARMLYIEGSKLAIREPPTEAPSAEEVASVNIVAKTNGDVGVEVGVRGFTPATGSMYTSQTGLAS